MTMQIGKGARIRLLHTDDMYTRLKPMDEGEIIDMTETSFGQKQIWVKWDSGSRLALIEDKDEFEYWFPYRGKSKK